MGCRRMVTTHYRPTIALDLSLVSASHDHWLDSQYHTLLNLDASTFMAKIPYRRLFVHLTAYTMTCIVANDSKTMTFRVLLNCMANVT